MDNTTPLKIGDSVEVMDSDQANNYNIDNYQQYVGKVYKVDDVTPGGSAYLLGAFNTSGIRWAFPRRALDLLSVNTIPTSAPKKKRAPLNLKSFKIGDVVRIKTDRATWDATVKYHKRPDPSDGIWSIATDLRVISINPSDDTIGIEVDTSAHPYNSILNMFRAHFTLVEFILQPKPVTTPPSTTVVAEDLEMPEVEKKALWSAKKYGRGDFTTLTNSETQETNRVHDKDVEKRLAELNGELVD